MARLVEAGKTLFAQIDKRWPGRDHASDGWIGTGGDHLPDADGWVHAIDIDSSFGGPAGYNTTRDAWTLANQLRRAMIEGDARVSYIIAWNPEKKEDYICSMNPAYQPIGTWRKYTLASHVNHIHVSFTQAAEQRGRNFNLPILNSAAIREVKKRIENVRDRKRSILKTLEGLVRKLKRLKG